jgi:hypothetical protein
LTRSHGLSQAKPKQGQGQTPWPWPGKSKAKAKQSQAKAMASGQSQASTSLVSIPHDNGYTISIVEKLEDLVTIIFLPLVVRARACLSKET